MAYNEHSLSAYKASEAAYKANGTSGEKKMHAKAADAHKEAMNHVSGYMKGTLKKMHEQSFKFHASQAKGTAKSFAKSFRARYRLRKAESGDSGGMYAKARSKALGASKKLVDLHQQRAAGGDVSHMHIAVAAEAAKNAHEKAMMHATKHEDVNLHEKHADKAQQIVNHAHAASLKEAFHPEVSKSMKQFHVVRVNGSNSDTHAHASLEGAHEMANPDHGDKVEHGVVNAKDAGAARLMKPAKWQSYKKSLRSEAMTDFNDFFKSENVCGECGSDLSKSHGAPKDTVAEDNKKGKKHAGTTGSNPIPITRAHGGGGHKKNRTEHAHKSDAGGEQEEQVVRKAFPVLDTFKAVEYVGEDGQLYSEIERFSGLR